MNYLLDTAAADSTVPACCRDIGEQWPDTAEPWTDAERELIELEDAPFPLPSIGTLFVVGLVIGLVASAIWPNPWWMP